MTGKRGTYRILITGTRRKLNKQQQSEIMNIVNSQLSIAESYLWLEPALVIGDCPTGVDNLIMEHHANLQVTLDQYHAHWGTEGKAAGPNRNQRMVDSGADVCLAFPWGESKGTWDCIRRAKKAMIRTRVFDVDGESRIK